jgi:MoaA/NifB/PqqE/SkfB family radical SAM enzyme
MKLSNRISNKTDLAMILFVSEKLSSKFDGELARQILEEMYLRPYLPSRFLSKIYNVKLQDLKSLYSAIRCSKEAKEFFALSAYPFLISLLDSLSKDAARTLTILNGKTPSPPFETLELFISEVCNAKCKFCYRDGQNYKYPATMSVGDYFRLINDFADVGGRNLDVSGGLEPLLSPVLSEVLQKGVERGLNVGLYTNGISLFGSRKLEQLMKINRVRVSLNAYDKQSYAETMGVDEFDRVISNIRNFVKVRDESGSKVKIGVSFVVYGDNYKRIDEVIKLAQELNIDYLGLRSVEVIETVGSGKEQEDELASILELIRHENYLGRYGKLNVSVADTFNVTSDSSCDSIKYLRRNLVSLLPHFRITVTPQGKLYALNLIGQPSREDDRFLLGALDQNYSLSDIANRTKSIPFEPRMLLAHDFSLIMALSKLASDLEFGISLKENPFNWTH